MLANKMADSGLVSILILFFFLLFSKTSGRGMNQLNRDALEAHNHYRYIHGVPRLKYSSKLADTALDWAQLLANNGAFFHRPGNIYGENLYRTTGNRPSGWEVSRKWYNEINQYQFGQDPSNFEAVGHFTQMIWRSTKEMGMGMAKGASGWVVVCNYSPSGNEEGQYAVNDPPPRFR